MKRLFFLLAMTLTSLAMMATAQSATTASGTCGDNLTWELTNDGVLTIDGTGAMTNYSNSPRAPWYNYMSQITTLIIGNGVTSIGTNDFGWGGLKSVYNYSSMFFTLGERAVYYAELVVNYQYNNVQSKYAPANKNLIYDIDGDGTMEFIGDLVKRTQREGSNNITIGYDIYSYSMYGAKDTASIAQFDLLKPYSVPTLSCVNSNNEEELDFTYQWQKGSSSYDTCSFGFNLLESSPIGYINRDLSLITEKRYYYFNGFPLDANLDGRMDFYSYVKGNGLAPVHYFYLRQADGSYLRTRLEILTDTAAIDSAIYRQWNNSSMYSGPMTWTTMPSVSDGWIHRVPERNTFKDESLQPLLAKRITSATDLSENDFNTLDQAIDLDRNGLVDLMSSTTGVVLYNLGNNQFLMGKFPGQVTVKDVNADGIMDYIIYDATNKIVTLQIYSGNGLFRTQTLMQNQAITNVWCYDFDKDGDIDILLPFDYTTSSGYAYLVFFRNDGNNTFKKVENAFDDPLHKFSFIDCKDVDNDGMYEIIAKEDSSLYAVHYTNKFKVSAGTPFVTNNTGEFYLSGDFNNDGSVDYWYLDFINQYTKKYILSHHTPSTPNTAPAKMSQPRILMDTERKMINVLWDRGSDAESSALDLEYAIRIGSTSGAGDMWYAASGADGKQRSLAGGNVGTWLNQWINVAGWTEGDYYIALQAIDPNGLGGAWSDEVVYHHSLLSADFVIDQYEMSTADTLIVQYTGVEDDTYTYQWDFGDSAIILSQAGQKYAISYYTPGEKTISLKVIAPDGTASPLETRSVKVWPLRFDARSSETILCYFDMDMDGVLDGVGGSGAYNMGCGFYNFCGASGFFRGRGDGTFIKIARTYNADFTKMENRTGDFVPKMIFRDYNMDGLPDAIFVASKGEIKRNIFINREDFDVEMYYETFYGIYNKPKGTEYLCDYAFSDINNDGSLDIYGTKRNGKGWSLHLCASANTYTLLNVRGVFYFLGDFNNDGLDDAICRLDDRNTGRKEFIINLQKEDGTFEELEGVSFNYNNDILGVADLNNDGWLDVLQKKNDYTIVCHLGDENLSFSQTKEIYLPTYPQVIGQYITTVIDFRDLDNNGYVDLLINGQVFVYMYADMEYETQLYPILVAAYKDAYTSPPSFATYPFIDLDGDGVPDSQDYALRSRITNQAPAVPQNIRAIQVAGGILLQWDAAVDKETPAAQMRYNISVKKQGMSVGEDSAFVISPMNGLYNESVIVPDYPYRRGTQMLIPINNFVVGQRYEFQIQAIDAWNAHSDMSAAYTFKVEQQVNLHMPQEACTDADVQVQYLGTESGSLQWNTDGGTIVSSQGNSCTLRWSTPGVKNVSVTINGLTATRAIHIKQSADLSFSFPSAVLAGAWIDFTLPAICMDPSVKVQVITSDNVMDKESYIVDGTRITTGKIMRDAYSLRAKVRFEKSNTDQPGYIELMINDSCCGAISYRATTQVIGSAPDPAIAIVTVDALTGKNKIIWDAPSDLPNYVDRIYVYKEEGSTNNWVRQCEMPVSAGAWIDLASNPAVRKNRYCMTYGTNFGAESNKSAVHSSTHLQMNVGLQGSVNLIWTKYEGGTVDQYRILRGSTLDNMSVIATVPGTENTYTDLNAPENAYYALEYDNLYFEKWIWMSLYGAPARMPAATLAVTRNGQSNIMASADKNEVTFAASINIRAMEQNVELNASQTMLHLFAEIMPATATIRQASWKIVTDNNLATIDDNGLLVANTDGLNGTVRVRATAMDGSGVYAERNIVVSGMTQDIPVQAITLNSISGGMVFNQTNTQITVEAVVTPVDATNTNMEWSVVSGADKVTITPNGKQCTVTMNANAENGDVLLVATAQDGSGVFGSLQLSVNKTAEPTLYNIYFYNYDFTLLSSIQVPEGEIPVYTGPEPTRESTVKFNFIFTDWYTYDTEENIVWGLQPAISHGVYFAGFTEYLREYTVIFVDWDGTEIEIEYVPYGWAASAPVNPEREGYTFTGWDKDFSFIEGDMVITAQYEQISTPTTYTILFVNWDNALLQTLSVTEGELPVYTEAPPTRPDDEQYTYTFIGWTPKLVAAIADATYTATYEAKDLHEGLEDIDVSSAPHKIFIDGVIYILRGDKTYTLQGQEVK